MSTAIEQARDAAQTDAVIDAAALLVMEQLASTTDLALRAIGQADAMGTRHGAIGRGQQQGPGLGDPVRPGRLDREEFERAFGENPRPFGLPDNRPVWLTYLRAYRAAVDARAYAGESGAWTR